MEKHRCKLCFRKFANGKALGGHMRSHTMNLNVSKRSYFSLSEEEESGEVKRQLSSESKETRNKFPSVNVQDRESETESSKKNRVSRRSKRVRRSIIPGFNSFNGFFQMKKSNLGDNKNYEHSSLSSITGTTPEEDVAHSLMMLSRDKWKGDEEEDDEYKETEYQEMEEKIGDDDFSEDSGGAKVKTIKVKGKYKCETCNRLFKSYQALGGHRTSHKKMKSDVVVPGRKVAAQVVEKIHECPFCDRVFASGQALGGHKRTHFIGAGANLVNVGTSGPVKSISRNGGILDIDLNFPAPIDDDEDEISQNEISEVSELL